MRILLLFALIACSFVYSAEDAPKKKTKSDAKPAKLIGHLMSKPGSAAADVICQLSVVKKGTAANLTYNLKGDAEITKKVLELLAKKALVAVNGKKEETYFQVESIEETEKDPNADAPKKPSKNQ